MTGVRALVFALAIASGLGAAAQTETVPPVAGVQPADQAPADGDAPAERSLSVPQPEPEILPTRSTNARPPQEPRTFYLAPFVDRFETLNERRWYVHHRKGNGWWGANDFKRSQVVLTPEGVVTTLAKGVKGGVEPYTSGEISSILQARYGYFEARVKTASGSGTDTGIFTYTRPGNINTWNEIDIEILGLRPDHAELTLHIGSKSIGKSVPLGFDSSKDFHTYGFDWQKDYVTFYVDNVAVYTVRDPALADLKRRQNFHLNLWGSNTLEQWMGKLDPNRDSWSSTFSCAAYASSYPGRALCAPATPSRSP